MDRRAFLTSTLGVLVGGSVVAAVGSAQEASPTSRPGSAFVGSWLLVVALPGEPEGLHLATFAADGTFVETTRPVQPAPADAPFQMLFPSPGHGVWSIKEPGTAELAFTRLLVDEGGNGLGTVPARATLELSEDGATISGSVVFETVDPDGTVIGSGAGTLIGQRIGGGTAAD